MRKITINLMGYTFFSVFLIVACASTELKRTSMDEAYKGKILSNILVIAVTDNQNTRRSFENKFVVRLKATGVDAVSSADGIPIPGDQKLEKDAILKAVQQFGNDAVIITHLVGVKETEVYNPAPRSYTGYYGYYGNVYGQIHGRGYYSTTSIVRLETNLYDAKTEKLIWSGQSETWNPESDKQTIDEVVKEVIRDLQKNKLLPTK